MDCKKVFALKTIVISLSLLFILGILQPAAAASEWINLTSFKYGRRIQQFGDTLFVATSGGILAIDDPDRPGRELINTDGLGTTDITDIIKDASGQLWVAGFGRLIKFDDGNSRQFLFADQDNNLIGVHRLVDDGDFLWVGCDNGLVLFSKENDGGQIQDSYGLFGDLNPMPTVLDIALTADSIYLATSSGIAIADRSNPILLKSPNNWKTFGYADHPAMFSDTVRSIALFKGEIYASTPRAFLTVDVAADSVARVPIGDGIGYANLVAEHDSLFLHFYDMFGSKMAVIVDSVPEPLSISGIPWQVGYPVTSTGNGTVRWVTVSRGGLFHSVQDRYQEYYYTGLPETDVNDVTVGTTGQITAAFENRRAAMLIDNAWKLYSFARPTTLAALDSLGQTWVGTDGDALHLLTEDTVIRYDETNSTMLGNTDDPPNGLSYVVIRGLDTDRQYVYIACYRAANGYPIAIGDLSNLDDPSGWDSLGVADSIKNVYVTSLDVHENWLAVGTEAVGVYVCDLGADPFDHSDDSCMQFTTDSGRLVSNAVRTVKFSPGGILWVGTNFGVSRYDPGREYFVTFDLPASVSSDITDLEFDGRGNLWVGTTDGLVFWNASADEFVVYKGLTSDIVSDAINNVTFDPISGRTFVATDAGISIIPSVMGTPTSTAESVIAYPNPFVINFPADRLSFNFLKAGRVRIYSVAGELVTELAVNDTWDGRNQKNEDVASGVYIFVLTDEDGNVGRGKILLVRM